MLKVADFSKLSTIKECLLRDKHTSGVYSLMGEWNIMSIVEFISMHDLRFWIEHLRKQFPEIVEHETVLLIDQLANNEFPNEVYEGIKKCNA